MNPSSGVWRTCPLAALSKPVSDSHYWYLTGVTAGFCMQITSMIYLHFKIWPLYIYSRLNSSRSDLSYVIYFTCEYFSRKINLNNWKLFKQEKKFIQKVPILIFTFWFKLLSFFILLTHFGCKITFGTCSPLFHLAGIFYWVTVHEKHYSKFFKRRRCKKKSERERERGLMKRIHKFSFVKWVNSIDSIHKLSRMLDLEPENVLNNLVYSKIEMLRFGRRIACFNIQLY